MSTAELENQLTRKIRTRRSLLAVATVLSILLFFGNWWLFESTKEVTRNPIIVDGIEVHPGFQSTQYNDAYLVPIISGLMLAALAGSFLLSDFLSVRFQTVTKNGYDLTVYRGFLHNIVYVNEKCSARPAHLNTIM